MFPSLLSMTIQQKPGVIVGPISDVLGVIFNFIFNMVYSLGSAGALGFTIIIFTFFVKLVLVPLSYKQQESMSSMQRIQPEIEKIKQKYKNNKDPEIQQKITMETQELYRKHKVNPFGGCLPLFVQLPILMALYSVMQRSYIYIDKIGELYGSMATKIIGAPGYLTVIKPLAIPKVPGKMTIDIAKPSDLAAVLNKFTHTDWNTLVASMPQDVVTFINDTLVKTRSIEYFLGINLIEKAGYMFPGILIPIIAGITTYASSVIISKQNPNMDANMKKQQMIMNITMPVMMGFMAINLPSGVGLYWIISNIFQVLQQVLLIKYFKNKNMKKKEAA